MVNATATRLLEGLARHTRTVRTRMRAVRRPVDDPRCSCSAGDAPTPGGLPRSRRLSCGVWLRSPPPRSWLAAVAKVLAAPALSREVVLITSSPRTPSASPQQAVYPMGQTEHEALLLKRVRCGAGTAWVGQRAGHREGPRGGTHRPAAHPPLSGVRALERRTRPPRIKE